MFTGILLCFSVFSVYISIVQATDSHPVVDSHTLQPWDNTYTLTPSQIVCMASMVKHNGGGTQGQPLNNFGGIPFPPPNIPAGSAQKLQPNMFGMSGPPKVASHDQDVPGQTGVQPRYLEEIEQHLRSESQADSRRDSTRQQKVVSAGESIDDPQKKEERPPLMVEGSRKNMNRTTSGEPSMIKQKSRRLTQHKEASQSFTVEGQPVYYTQEQSKPPVSQNEPKQHFLWRGRPRRGRI